MDFLMLSIVTGVARKEYFVPENSKTVAEFFPRGIIEGTVYTPGFWCVICISSFTIYELEARVE